MNVQQIQYKYYSTPAFGAVNMLTPYQSGIAKLNKITKSEYLSLTEPEKESIRRTTASYSNTLHLHDVASNTIKDVMDREFGNENWVAVIIGRSLSSVGKMLSLKIGDDRVKSIPMSNLRGKDYCAIDYNIYKEAFRDLDFTNPLATLPEYLKTIGLTKAEIQNSKKQYVILDYAALGKSIKNAYALLTSDLCWGTDRNVTFVDIEPIMDCAKEKTLILRCLDECIFKDYSFVPNVDKVGDIFKEVIPPSDKCRQKLGFGMLDMVYGNAPKSPNKGLNEDRLAYLSRVSAPLIPQKNRRIWNTPTMQIEQDVLTDVLALNNLKYRLQYLYGQSDFYLKRQQKVGKCCNLDIMNDVVHDYDVLTHASKRVQNKPYLFYFTTHPTTRKLIEELSKKYSCERVNCLLRSVTGC